VGMRTGLSYRHAERGARQMRGRAAVGVGDVRASVGWMARTDKTVTSRVA